MNILGQGLGGVVVEDTSGFVKKFYKSKENWEHEKTNLTFLSDIQKQGFGIGCKIPKVIDSFDKTEWKINDKTYSFCNKMEFVPGLPANLSFDTKDLKVLGNNLGSVLFSMHSKSKKYVPQWVNKFGQEDKLLVHIFQDKARRVIREEADRDVKAGVENALSYLKEREALLMSQRTLSHLDLNLSNILVSKENSIEGIVDWGDFGFTNPSLSMYQLATTPKLWVHIQEQYRKLGGIIMGDVLYAAATIHLAWAPLIFKELGLQPNEDDTRERFEEMYARFKVYKAR